MDTNAIIARIEELNDIQHRLFLNLGECPDPELASARIAKLEGEIKGLTYLLCERDVHDFEDEVREFGNGGEIHFIVCQSCGNREQVGVVEPDEEDWPPAE
jgi:hypothetical protein